MTLLAEMRERQQAVGKRVVEMRERQRWSQEELAAKAGVSTKTISRLENGRYESRRNTIDRVAAALGISADELDPAPQSGPLGLGAPAKDVVDSSEVEALRGDVAALHQEVAQIAANVADITALMRQLLDPMAGLLQAQDDLLRKAAEIASEQVEEQAAPGGRRAAV